MDDIQPRTFPSNVRPGTRTFSVVTNEFGLYKLSRVDLTLDDVIREELEDYLNGRDGSAELGIDADTFAWGEDDRAIWEGPRLLAVIRPRAGGDPQVFRFDGPSLDRAPDA